jgi:hypothetical protein
MLALAGCDRVTNLVSPRPAKPLEPAAQALAADRLTAAFAGDCLTAANAEAATRALEAKGWPSFGTVWSGPQPFYAAKPSKASPAGLFVLGTPRWNGTAAYQLTCVGHYPALTAAPMQAAMEARWGPGRPGQTTYPGSTAWEFRLRPGAPPTLVGVSLPSAADVAALAPGEAIAYGQVYYNAAQRDVASLMAVYRRPAA